MSLLLKTETKVIHYFKDKQDKTSFDEEQLPKQFTYPFHYQPHPLVVKAAMDVKDYLVTRKDWQEELSHGKMFGVLIVESAEQKIGYLAGFSGNLAGSNHHSFFVPPVFDLLRPGDFFKLEESNISAINKRIWELEHSENFLNLKRTVQTLQESSKLTLEAARTSLKEEKTKRDKERNYIISNIQNIKNKHKDYSTYTLSSDEVRFVTSSTYDQLQLSDEEILKRYEIRLQELIRESQFQKAEFKRLERKLKEANTGGAVQQLKATEDEIANLKQERKTRSAALQLKLFEHFRLLNARHEIKDLTQIFKEVRHATPPAGAGECALPKMLQYAYLNALKPLAFGEFWWGESPKDEIRKHGQFYPSCKGKCEPILRHMLIGLNVEPSPLLENKYEDLTLKILYEDDWIAAIEKPAGMLSTPGKEVTDSVSARLQKMYPHATGPLLVHRLDMATSGILLVAKNKEVHAELQTYFEARKIHKIYTAILDGIPTVKEGCVNLPLCLNPMDRPRQMVSYTYGKEAITYYRVLKTKGNNALVEFDLKTGRTHQIRVHAAHPDGLNCPIKGDDLYGVHADRLYLHATEVNFVHPVTKKLIHIKSEVPFKL